MAGGEVAIARANGIGNFNTLTFNTNATLATATPIANAINLPAITPPGTLTVDTLPNAAPTQVPAGNIGEAIIPTTATRGASFDTSKLSLLGYRYVVDAATVPVAITLGLDQTLLVNSFTGIGSSVNGSSVNGAGGNIIVEGGGGNIVALTGASNRLYLAEGPDTVDAGSSSSSTIFGGTGATTINGSSGTGNVDFLSATPNVVNQGSGTTTIVGGAGAATIFGGTGADTIFGNTGAELITGGSGSLTLVTASVRLLQSTAPGRARPCSGRPEAT